MRVLNQIQPLHLSLVQVSFSLGVGEVVVTSVEVHRESWFIRDKSLMRMALR